MKVLLYWLIHLPYAFGWDCDPFQFPDNFIFGTSSSAYQVEGGWNEDGKGPSWMDWFTNKYDSVTGNVACDSYHKYKEDVAALKMIGADYYRFSISWTRILPYGTTDQINQAGVNYYNKLLDELEAAGIKPLVTIFHWDTPNNFSAIGFWNSRDMVNHFVAYADLAFQLFGHRVKLWATINEPLVFCVVMPQYINKDLSNTPLNGSEYLCIHHLLLAHAHAYRLYQQKYKPTQKGKVGLVLNMDANLPLTNSTEDLKAAARANIFSMGWSAEPIVFGDYPELMKRVVAENSAAENLTRSRLPTFTAMEKKLLKQSFDVFFLNHYSAYQTTPGTYNSSEMSWRNDKQVASTLYSSGGTTNVGFSIYPESIKVVLKYISQNYGHPEIIITENGFSNTGGLNDTDRVDYIKSYLRQARLAMCEDNVTLSGYFYWSLLDSYEWNSKYEGKFGVVDVNFNDTYLNRTLKLSAFYYKNLIQTHNIKSNLSP